MPKNIEDLVKELEENAKTENGARAKMSLRAARLIRGLYEENEQITISQSSMDSN